MTNDRYILNAVRKLCRYCKQISENGKYENEDFLSESDLKCFLYAELVDFDSLTKFKFANDDEKKGKLPRISLVHTEVQYGWKDKGKRKVADLAVINSDELTISKEGYNLKGEIKQSRLIEIKMGHSKKKCIDKIEKDCEKLAEAGLKKKGYVICYHQSFFNQRIKRWLQEKDVAVLKNRGVSVIYIRKDGEFLTKPKSLLEVS